MADDFTASCNRFCLGNICKFLISIVLAGASVASLGFAAWVALDRMARSTETATWSNTAALDAHIVQERQSTAEIMEVLGDIKTDLTLVKYRLDSGRNASVSAPAPLAAPEHP